MSQDVDDNNHAKEITRKSLSNSKHITIIDFKNNPTKSINMNSPRSLSAIKKANYLLEQLYFVSFDDFKKYPDNIPASYDIQKDRYKFNEQSRQNRIREITQIRDDIINNNESNQCYKSKDHTKTISKFHSKSSPNNHNEIGIENDTKEYKQMKMKSELQVMAMIHDEVQRELMKQKSEEKERYDREKAAEYKKMIKEKHEKEEANRRVKQQMISHHLRTEENNRLMKEKQRKDKEEKKKRKAEELEQLRQSQIEKNRQEIEQKSREFQNKMNKNLEGKINKQIEEQQRELEIKEQQRKRLMEENRIKAQNENSKKQLKKRKQLEKQNIEENKERMKSEELNEKQEERIIKKKQLEEQKIKKKQRRRMKVEQKEERMMQILQEKKMKINRTINEIIGRLENKEVLIKCKQDEIKQNQIRKREDSLRYRILKEEKILRQSREEMNKREELEEELINKSQKINEYFAQKKVIDEEKKNMKTEIAKKKKEYTQKFESLLKKNKFDDKSILELKQMFPENNQINEMIDEMKGNKQNRSQHRSGLSYNKHQMAMYDSEKKAKKQLSLKTSCNVTTNRNSVDNMNNNGTNSNKPTYNSQDIMMSEQSKSRRIELPQMKKSIKSIDNNKKEKPKISEEEIRHKVNEYKVSMNNQLLNLIAYERNQEQLREEIMNKLISKTENRKMELEFGKERTLASNRIIKKNK